MVLGLLSVFGYPTRTRTATASSGGTLHDATQAEGCTPTPCRSSFPAAITCQFLPTVLFASDETAGTFGASYLRVPVGAALMSVPDVVVAMDPDGSLAFSNPAGISRVSQSCVFFSRANWLDELSLNAAGAVMPIPRHGLAFSIGSRLLYAGELNGFDGDRSGGLRGQLLRAGLVDVSEQGDSRAWDCHWEWVSRTCASICPRKSVTDWRMSFGMSYEHAEPSRRRFRRGCRGDDVVRRARIRRGGAIHAGLRICVQTVVGVALDVGTQVGFLAFGAERSCSSERRVISTVSSSSAAVSTAWTERRATSCHSAPDSGSATGPFMLDYAFTPQEYFASTHTFSVGFLFGGGRSGAPAPSSPPWRHVPAALTYLRCSRPPARNRPRTEKPKEHALTYEIIAGVHSREESARAEVRALRLVKVSASVETVGNRYKVLVGKYDSRSRPQIPHWNRYEKLGHRFQIETL